MIVFAGVTPHSPLLLPQVNPEGMHAVSQTTEAMQEFSRELYAARPDTIVLLSEHPYLYSDSFSINLHDPIRFDLSELGVLDYPLTVKADHALADRVQRSLRREETRITLTSDVLHYASAVPLSYIVKTLPNVPILPITYSELDDKEHFLFGQALQEALFHSNKRIAIIASGDLSHRVKEESPSGFHESGPIFDTSMQEILVERSSARLLSFDPAIRQTAEDHTFRQWLMLFGALDGIATTTSILSYEAPVGVGYLVATLMPE